MLSIQKLAFQNSLCSVGQTYTKFEKVKHIESKKLHFCFKLSLLKNRNSLNCDTLYAVTLMWVISGAEINNYRVKLFILSRAIN